MANTDYEPIVDKDGEEWLAMGEAADYLGVSPFVVRRLARRGDVPSYRSPLDRRVRFFKISDLDALEMERVPTR